MQREEASTGYLSRRYAQSLAEFGVPRRLSHCGGWVLERHIPEFPYYDLTGCYPLFSCQEWSHLHVDLEGTGNEPVSLSLVADPFGNYGLEYLHQCFDRVIPFKKHFIVDLSRPIDTFVCNHHRRYARKAFEEVRVEKCEDPLQLLDDWVELYDVLIERNHITGIQTFSRKAFAKQLEVPGVVVFRAVAEDTTVSMLIWYVQGHVSYYHLGASNALGYDLTASFALFWAAIEYFANLDLQWIDLGAGAGVEADSSNGLSRFKRGWCTGTRTTYFCGRIFDKTRYSEIVEAKGIHSTDYFPAYRKGEFE